MPDQEEGWPLGLEPINSRVGFNNDSLGSISFNTSLTASPTSSSDSSSDLDTESTGSFFHDRTITLGNLIGVNSILEFSRRRSLRRRKFELSKEKSKSKTKTNNKIKKSNTWCFSCCASANSMDAKLPKTGPSLGHFLEVERKVAIGCRRIQLSPTVYGPEELASAQPISEPNSLFVNGFVAPQRSKSSQCTDKSRREISGTGCGISFRLSKSICGQNSSH